MTRSIFFAIALSLALQSTGAVAVQDAASGQAAVTQTAAPALGQIDIPEAELPVYVKKSNAVVELLNTSIRGKESLERYLSWADAKRGPTGKERIIYGLYSVGSSANSAITKARLSAAAAPAIPALDDATKGLADAFEALIPILNEASSYYDRKDYLGDNMDGGKALHARLMPAAKTFLAARERLDALQDQFKGNIDKAQLAKIEKAEGKSVRWHVTNTMMLAKKCVDLLPESPNRNADLKPFDAALAAYGVAVKNLDDAVRASGKSTSINSEPADILGRMREMRDNIAKGRTDSMTFSMSYNGIISTYNTMVTLANAFQ